MYIISDDAESAILCRANIIGVNPSSSHRHTAQPACFECSRHYYTHEMLMRGCRKKCLRILRKLVGAVSKVLSNYHGLLSAIGATECTSDHEESDPDLRDFVTPQPKPNSKKKHVLVLANI